MNWPRVIKILDSVDGFTIRSGKIIAVLIVFLTLMLVIEVIFRYFLNYPTVWAHELSAYLFGCYFMLGGFYGILRNSHVNVELVYTRVPLKYKVILLDCLNFVFIFLVCLTLTWHGGEIAWDSLLAREQSTAVVFSVPVYPLRMVIAVSGALVGIQALAKLIRRFHALKTFKDST